MANKRSFSRFFTVQKMKISRAIPGDDADAFSDSIQKNQGFHMVLSVPPTDDWGSWTFETTIFIFLR